MLVSCATAGPSCRASSCAAADESQRRPAACCGLDCLRQVLIAKGRSTRLARKEARGLLQWLGGRAPTAPTLQSWGFDVPSICPKCGAEDGPEHRLLA